MITLGLRRVLLNPSAEVVFDPDAEAFFTRASITDDTQKSAWNSAVLSLKSASLWTKLELIYPFIGGDATSHSKNAKSDTFNITWAGTLTHDANGITGDGSTGWGDTGWATDSASIATQDSVHAFCYCRTETPTDLGRLLGTANNAGTSRIGVLPTASNLTNDGPHDGESGSPLAIGASSDFRGSMMVARTASNAKALYLRSLSPSTSTTASTAATTGTLGILARNFQGFGPDSFSNANLAFVSAGGGLDSTEYTTLNGIVKAFQDALGRSVAD